MNSQGQLRAIARLVSELKTELAWVDESLLQSGPPSGPAEVPVRSSEISRPTETAALDEAGRGMRKANKRAQRSLERALDALLDARADVRAIFGAVDRGHVVTQETDVPAQKLGKAEMRRLKAAQVRRES